MIRNALRLQKRMTEVHADHTCFPTKRSLVERKWFLRFLCVVLLVDVPQLVFKILALFSTYLLRGLLVAK